MYNALDIAKYFIKLASPEAEDWITNLKLQKLLYYAQGFHLALYGKPLFNEEIEAWHYGPVVPDVYHTYKEFKTKPIPQPEYFNLDEYDKETQELLDEVYQVYGQYTAPVLAHFTHQELPWKNTPPGDKISDSLLKAYFETQLIK